ncbi:rod shape-determining protein MreC [Deefgea piscis]|uniref:Cell shape-determining protein MreC n=1 Tax=Deefgea piscis TaxID=2739061 RepID=A0A8G1GY64_9NEIS|nr:rod shape-determining protein MreC [Deefgea piscis]QKJ66002.1 rod shape-determining protein MreC [Deefgea piscis]QZA81095.1 rod shape-determining protein MreC [Deefgea piscis]QZA81138.1 rod shape-determining protein MreC [Deefgea piscis]
MQANQPAFFKQGPKPLTRVLIFSALSLALIFGDANYQWLGLARDKLSLALYPLQWLATTPINAVIEGGDFLQQQAQLVSENKALNNDKLAAKGMAMRLQALEIENANLRSLSIASENTPRRSQLTKILYNSRDPFAAKLVLDKGQQNQISAGQIVLDASGVVGQIVRVQPLTSEVRLLSDRNHMVPVIVARNQLRTVVYGTGRHAPLEVRNMAQNVDVQVGDQLLTSGIDSIYPAGLPVARVTRVERTTGNAFARIYSEPLAKIDQHRYFLILDAPAAPPPYPTEASAPKAKTK